MVEKEDVNRSKIATDLESIIRDNTSGSTSILRDTTRLMIEMDRVGMGVRTIKTSLEGILRSHKDMAVLIHLTDRVFEGIDEGREVSELMELEKEKRASDLSNLVRNAVERIKSASKIVTISNSSTIIEILTEANQRGAGKEVIISEGRPALEGVLAARKLASKGIKVTMVADGALPQESIDSDLVIVGADSVTEKGIVNKIGTLGLASVAEEYGIPVFSAFTTDKIIANSVNGYRKRMQPKAEIMEDERGIDVSNYYFDLTPLEKFTHFITQLGEMGTSDLIEEIEGMDIHSSVVETIRNR